MPQLNLLEKAFDNVKSQLFNKLHDVLRSQIIPSLPRNNVVSVQTASSAQQPEIPLLAPSLVRQPAKLQQLPERKALDQLASLTTEASDSAVEHRCIACRCCGPQS